MSAAPAPTTSSANHGWIVTFAGLGINLALGVLYAWSMFKDAIAKEFGWQGARTQRSLHLVLSRLRHGHDFGRTVPGQTRAAGHRFARWTAHRLRPDPDLVYQQLRPLAPRIRRPRRAWHGLRVFIGHSSRAEVVPSRQNWTHRRTRCRGIRIGSGLPGTAFEVSRGQLPIAEVDAHSGRLLPRGHRRPGPASQESARRIRCQLGLRSWRQTGGHWPDAR